MIGHLGTRVTVLLDGRMAPSEEERAWEHVHACHGCRDAVEREGWVKTHLAQWGQTSAPSADHLKAALLAAPFPHAAAATPRTSAMSAPAPIRAGATVHPGAALRARHAVAWGGSALGVAVMGLVALGAAPANTPFQERRTVTSIVPASVTSPSPSTTTTAVQGPAGTGTVSTLNVPVRLGRTHDTMVP